MAKIQLIITADKTQAEQAIDAVDKKLADLGNKKIEIKVDNSAASNLQSTTSQAQKLTNSLEKVQTTMMPSGDITRRVETYNQGLGKTVQITRTLDKESGLLEETSRRITTNYKEQKTAAEAAAQKLQQQFEKATQGVTTLKGSFAALQSSISGKVSLFPEGTFTQLSSDVSTARTQLSQLNAAYESGKISQQQYISEEQRLRTELANLQTRFKELQADTQKVSKETKEFSANTDKLSNSAKLANTVLKNLTSQAIQKLTSALKSALQEMKNVDDELITVRKVTGATAEELEQIEKKAYSVASAYGETASEYLNAVSAFTRAGYREQATELAELATQTKIVGDTTEEIAQQFLLSVDAAYKYQGNIEQLSKVLDGANEIDNKYATSIEKIAEGLGKVAPIASQAHVGVDELSAAIGTVTAVTQRSGTEAATALRALFLNIIGDTKTEIEDGATWTAGEIEGLRDVIKTYASEAYEAAEATGSIINPMEAIAGLAQSMKDGVLTEQQLMSMVSDIGGKLRTSQLLALIENWDMYQSMLNDYANSVGSADKEVENALDSWTRKTNILKNEWTEFISNTIDSEAIKGILDMATAVVDFSDNLALAATFGLSFFAIIKNGKTAFLDFATAGRNASAALTSWATAAAAVTAAISIGMMIHKQYEQRLQETAAASKESAEKAIEAADGMRELRDSMDEVKRSGGDFREAFEQQISTLNDTGETVGDLIQKYGSLEAAIRGVADELERKAVAEAAAAVSDAGKVVEEKRHGPIDIFSAFNTFDPTARSVEWQGFDDDIVALAVRVGELRQDDSAEGSLEYYEALIDLQTKLKDLALDNEAIYDTLLYKNVNAAVESGSKFMDAYADATAQAAYQQTLLTNGMPKTIEEMYAFMDAIRGQAGGNEYTGNMLAAYAKGQLPEITFDSSDEAKAARDRFLQDTFAQGKTAWDVQDILAEYNARIAALEKAEIAASEATDDLNDNLEESQRLASANALLADSAKELSENISNAQDAFNEFNEDGAVSNETLRAIKEAFADVDGIDDYIDGLADTSQTADELKDKLAALVTEKIKLSYTDEDLAGASADVVSRLLKEAGVANSDAVAMQLVTAAKLKLALASDDGSAALDTFIEGLDAEAKQCGMTKIELVNLVAQESIFNNSELDASQKITELQKLAVAARITGSALEFAQNYNKIAQIAQQYGITDQDQIAQAVWNSMVGDAVSSVTSYGVDWDPGTSKSKSSSNKEDKKLERLKEIVELRKSELQLLEDQDAPISDQIAKIREIESALKNQQRYMEAAGKSQADINALKSEQLSLEKQILELQNSLWDELEVAVNKEREKAKNARQEELDALDDEKQKLQDARDAQKDKTDLAEKELKVQEALADLQKAQNERTIRRLQNGTWEWVVDESAIKSAQETYDSAVKDLEDTKADLEYEAKLDEIERRKQAINDAYDAIESNWETILDSVQEPTREIAKILDDIAKNGTPEMKTQIENVNACLASLSNYIAMATGSATGWSYSGTGNSQNYSTDKTDYSLLMLNSKTQEEFDMWAAERTKKMEAQGIDPAKRGIRSNADLAKETGFISKYDSGGILRGMGGIKATDRDESVLGPELTQAILKPSSNAQFSDFAKSLGVMFGVSRAASEQRIFNTNQTSSLVNSNNSNVTYINGVKIGSDMMQRPLSEVLSTLSLHTERGN